MKIDETLSGANGVNAVDRAHSMAESSAAAGRLESGSRADGAAAGDSATLSAGATLASHLANGSDVRMEKVTSVQQSLAAWTYRVDAGKVADKVIASMLQKP
jgi:flagellar biosynthesis anti-sigma factor FlgM